MYEVVKIIAQIEYKESSKGRQTPFLSGYRPLFTFPNARTNLSGSITLLDRKSFSQGEIGEVQITFNKGIIDNVHFKVGERFTYAEGPNLLGEGEIIKLISI